LEDVSVVLFSGLCQTYREVLYISKTKIIFQKQANVIEACLHAVHINTPSKYGHPTLPQYGLLQTTKNSFLIKKTLWYMNSKSNKENQLKRLYLGSWRTCQIGTLKQYLKICKIVI